MLLIDWGNTFRPPMLPCPYCETETPPADNFCSSCYRQVRCLDCGSGLRENAPICLNCGHRVQSEREDRPQNTYSLREKITKSTAEREISLSLSDEAIGSVGGLFGGSLPMQGGQLGLHIPSQKQTPSLPQLNAAEAKVVDVTPSNTPPKTPSPPEPENETSDTLFVIDGESIKPTEVDFKADSLKGQQDRFSTLFLYFFERIQNRKMSSVNQICDAAKKIKLYDGHFKQYAKAIVKKYGDESDDGIEMGIAGNKKAREYLSKLDSDTEGYNYWDRTPSTTGDSKKPSLSHLDRANVDRWKLVDSRLSKLDISSLSTVLDWVLFALYDITSSVGGDDDKAASPAAAYVYLTERYSVGSLKAASFRVTMSRSDLVAKNPEGKYYLHPSGKATIESKLGIL